MREHESCAFCAIVRGEAPASVVYEDEAVMAFLTLSQVRAGECVVIPRTHIDHFIDLPERLASHAFLVAQAIGRALQLEFEPLRMGLVIHGFGVPHVHLILVPQHTIHDITSARYAVVEGGEVRFRQSAVPPTAREELDSRADRIKRRLKTLRKA